MNNINDLQEQIDNLIKKYQELIERLKEEQNTDVSKKVRWKPEAGENYYYIDTEGDIGHFYWFGASGSSVDRGLYKFGNCFKTKEEAQKELDRRLAEQELLNLCDWEKDKLSYEIEYNFSEKCFKADAYGTYYSFSPYRFASEESVKKAIDTLGEDKLKLIFRID